MLNKYANPKTGKVIVLLIILQFCLTPLISLFWPFSESGWSQEDYSILLSTYSYTMIVLGVLIFRAQKQDFVFDSLSLWMIVFGCVFRPSTGSEYDAISSLYLGALGLGFAIYLIAYRKAIVVPTIRTMSISILWAIVTVVILSMVAAMISAVNYSSFPVDIEKMFLVRFFEQVSFVTVIEETMFRGLLVGFLILNGYKESAAFAIQAILFWGAHYAQINNPLVFFVFLPLLVFSLTMIVQKHKILFASILVHTLVNVFATSLAAWLQILIF